MSDLLQKIFFVLYALTKELLPSRLCDHRNRTVTLIGKLLITTLTILWISIILIFLLPFAIFRMLLTYWLKFKYGEKFGGFLKGYDTIYENDFNGAAIKNIVIFSSPDESTLTIKKLKVRLENVYKNCNKLSSSINRLFGYHYYLKDQVKFEECLEYINDKRITRNSLPEYTKQVHFHLKQNQTWKAVFIPIETSTYKDNNTQVAIVFVFRHSLGDGGFILALLDYYMYDNTEKINIKNLKTVPTINFCNTNLLINPCTLKDDGKKLKIQGNNNSHIASFLENEVNYFPIIKKLKQDLNVTFDALIITVIWIATCEYLKQRKIIFNNLTVVKTTRFKMNDIFHEVNGKSDFNKASNQFGVVGLNIPPMQEERSIISIVSDVNRQLESIRYSVHGFMSYVVTNGLFYFLPAKLSMLMCSAFLPTATIGITNLALLPKKSCGGYVVEHNMGYIFEAINAVLKFFLVTYDNRIHFIVTSNKGYVNNAEELDNILINIFRNIDNLKKEVSAAKGS